MGAVPADGSCKKAISAQRPEKVKLGTGKLYCVETRHIGIVCAL
jgi:hypothetical protein